jgi:hypothetical protein
MPELVTIPTSYFEYAAEFERPIMALWLDRAEMVQAVFDALAPWDVTVDDVEGKNEGKPADQGVLFKLPKARASFFFGPAKCRFSKDSADWGQAEELIRLIDTAKTALLKSSGAVVKQQKTIVAFHFQPKTLNFRDLLRPFWPAKLLSMHSDSPKTGAVLLRWDNFALTLDGSGSVANGLFLRLEHTFPAAATYEQIAAQIRTDENSSMALIGVVEEQP